MKHITSWILTGSAALLAGGYIFLCTIPDPARILPGTTINGTALDDMTLDEAAGALEKNDRTHEGASLTVAFEGKSYSVDVTDALVYDHQAAAKKALKKSEKAQKVFFTRGLALLKSLFTKDDIEDLPAVKDTAALKKAIADSGLTDANNTVQTSYEIKDDQLVFTIGTAGEDVDEDALIEKIRQAVRADDYENVLACPDTMGEVRAVDLDQVYADVHVDAADATLDPANDYAVVEAVTGVDVDWENARALLDAAEEGSTVALDLIYTEPPIDAQNLREHLFADHLSSYTTKVSGTADRLTNVALAVEKCSGSILISGDVFSFNDTVGEQSEATGFKKASAIDEDGNIVQAYGGGICQVSSTIFAAALYSNLKIVERWNHDYVSSYIPAGIDATVAWGWLDLRIANDKSYPIRFDVSYENGDLTVDIWGTKTEEVPVEIETKTVASPAPGTLAVETYRKVFNADKSQVFVEKIADSTYRN